MSDTQIFFALDRKATEEFLAMAIKDMDDLTLKNAVHTLISSYRPSILKDLQKDIVPAWCAALKDLKKDVVPAALKDLKKDVVPAWPATLKAFTETVIVDEDKDSEPETVIVDDDEDSEPEMRTATDKNIRTLMKKHRIGWEEAWKELRCLELEDGDSICCTEECSEREDEADEDLVEAARRGKKKREARQAGAGRHVSYEDKATKGEDSVKPPYIAPPKVRDAEKFWPFMRCKNVANALRCSTLLNRGIAIPRNHHGLLEYIAKAGKVSVETLKKTDARDLFKDNYLVMAALGKSSRW